MQELYLQVNTLIIITGVSLAVIQYIFNNHQANLKDLLLNLTKLDFNTNNEYDKQLEERWEKAVSACKKHTYAVSPNQLIIAGFILIALISVLFLLLLLGKFYEVFLLNYAKHSILVFAFFIVVFLCFSVWIIKQMLLKERSFKKALARIKKEHNIVGKILNKTNIER